MRYGRRPTRHETMAASHIRWTQFDARYVTRAFSALSPSILAERATVGDEVMASRCLRMNRRELWHIMFQLQSMS